MKIVMVSMPTLHFFRWSSQLKDAGHEVYWFDITGMSTPVAKINWVTQYVDWKLKWNYPGRSFLKKKFPRVYNYLQQWNEKDTAKEFEKYIKEIQPDVVHSFALYVSCAPIIGVMEKYKNLKWIYSSWGSDLFFFQNESTYLKDIKRVLPRVNYLFTDCKRDYIIAKEYGFTGEFLGVFPGGGGFDLEIMESYKKPIKDRNTILIKGFQGRSGRAIPVLKAVESLQKELIDYTIVVFGADVALFDYLKTSMIVNWSNVKIIGKIPHDEVLRLMGEALIYMGNSNSDGMPNTLLEAICMGAFPIQSNPGNVTAEIIQDGINGFLIEDCEAVFEIENVIKKAIKRTDFENIQRINYSTIAQQIDFNFVKEKVNQTYLKV